MWRGLERRRFPRVNYKCLVIMNEGSGQRQLTGYAQNIGVGGLCVILDEETKRFDDVSVKLTLDDGGSLLECAGKVVWSIRRSDVKDKKLITRFDIGIEFIDLPGKERARIERVINRRVQRIV